MENLGPCVVVRPRQDGTMRLRFEVRRNIPEGWPRSRPILVNGRDGISPADLTPAIKNEVERTAADFYRELSRRRLSGSAGDTVPPPITRSWSELINLRREHSNWQDLQPASRTTYASTQKRIVELLGWSPALAPSVVLESQIDRIFLDRAHSAHQRKKLYLEVSVLLKKAVREGWRAPGLTVAYKPRLPKPAMRTWTPGDLRCAVSAAITDGERGLARLLLTQWEIGQRLQSVRNFRYGYHYKDGAFFYTCIKTRREIRISVVNPTARKILDEEYRHGAYMFPRAIHGKPFTGVELTKAFTRIRNKLKGFDQKLQLRQLRHTVVLELALAGCTIPEIASITSHELATVHQTLQHYLSANPILAAQAVEKRERRRLEDIGGLKGEVVVEGARLVYLGDLPEAATPCSPVETASHEAP